MNGFSVLAFDRTGDTITVICALAGGEWRAPLSLAEYPSAAVVLSADHRAAVDAALQVLEQGLRDRLQAALADEVGG